ncbi:hypothetical protein ACS0TY_010472 [Phlomoides rotata]
MANVRLTRFITEVAPPQFVGVRRRRGSKMLDTIHEEERKVTTNTLSKFPTSHSYNAIRTLLQLSFCFIFFD